MGDRREENLQKIRAMAEAVQKGTASAVVPVEYTSFDGTVYEGNVEFKRPNMRDYVTIGVQKGKYIQGQLGGAFVEPAYIDETVKFLAHMMATLDVVMVKRPVWLLDVEAVEDFGLLDHVYGRYQDWIGTFRAGDTDEPAGDSEATE